MFMSAKELRLVWNVWPSTVLHVGAHKGEEFSTYSKLKVSRTVWIEAQPDLVRNLELRFKGDTSQAVVSAAVWSTNDEIVDFQVASNSESSSILDLKLHSVLYPEVKQIDLIQLRTRTLDSIIPAGDSIDFVNIDIQGAELEALKGATRILSAAKWVYLEVNDTELYKNCPLLSEIDFFMENKGYVRVAKRMWLDHGWGDALYIRSSLLRTSISLQRFWKLAFDAKWQVGRSLRGFLQFLRKTKVYLALVDRRIR
jgi:FkbM family methyltransferase